METVYDWVTVLIFAGLITLFLQRSSMDDPPDTIWHYMPPAIGCAVANYLGNEGMTVFAVAMIVAVIGYIFVVLKPLRKA
ncbi:XrtV sorting system accessory protein [Qipengyuania sp.]|uniref:XrtV sorting system accessory protein n=1 Tax=Qipengyuania sp. TaxID=2004515 RepID=UPI003736B6F3